MSRSEAPVVQPVASSLYCLRYAALIHDINTTVELICLMLYSVQAESDFSSAH